MGVSKRKPQQDFHTFTLLLETQRKVFLKSVGKMLGDKKKVVLPVQWRGIWEEDLLICSLQIWLLPLPGGQSSSLGKDQGGKGESDFLYSDKKKLKKSSDLEIKSPQNCVKGERLPIETFWRKIFFHFYIWEELYSWLLWLPQKTSNIHQTIFYKGLDRFDTNCPQYVTRWWEGEAEQSHV